MEPCRQSIKKYEKMETKDLNELNSALSGCILNKKQETEPLFHIILAKKLQLQLLQNV